MLGERKGNSAVLIWHVLQRMPEGVLLEKNERCIFHVR